MNTTTDAGNGGPWEWRPDTGETDENTET